MNNTNVNAPYGLKNDGTPRKRPGKKASGTTTKNIWVYNDGNGNYTPRKGIVGRPSLETLKSRRLVTIPKNDEYEQAKHGIGEVQERDLIEISRLELVNAKKALATTVAAVTPTSQPSEPVAVVAEDLTPA